MNKNDLDNFLIEMKKAVLAAGEVAVDSQNKVKNIGKEVEDMENDSEYIQKMRAAKTIIDDEVQEIILSAVANVLDPGEIFLDAEEDTPSVGKFSSDQNGLTIVIDPIDGTLQYVSGSDNYAICMALIEKGDILASIVYFPSRKEFYAQRADKVTYEKNGSVRNLESPSDINNNNIVYINDRIDAKIADEFMKSGFHVICDAKDRVTWPEALIRCMNGEIDICIFHTPQIRDILLGVMISKIPGGYACDWNGRKISWPPGGRIPRVMFGFGKISPEIITCLK